jgi:hypothetical protein
LYFFGLLSCLAAGFLWRRLAAGQRDRRRLREWRLVRAQVLERITEETSDDQPQYFLRVGFDDENGERHVIVTETDLYQGNTAEEWLLHPSHSPAAAILLRMCQGMVRMRDDNVLDVGSPILACLSLIGPLIFVAIQVLGLACLLLFFLRAAL